MDPDLFLILPTVVVTIVAVGFFSLAGWRMWLRRPPGADIGDLPEHIREDLRALIREEMSDLLAVRDGELEDLSERIEFAERLLSRQLSAGEIGDAQATPV